MAKEPLTQKEFDRLEKIVDLIERKAPVKVTLSDVKDLLELSSDGHAEYVVSGLIRDGYLIRRGRKHALMVAK